MEIIGKRDDTACFILLSAEGLIIGRMGEQLQVKKSDNKTLPGLLVGVESALWSLLLSLAICVAAVSVFTAHLLLLLPVLITILGKI